MPQNLLDQRALRRLDKRDHLHRRAALRTGQRIDLVHPLDEHRPGRIRPRGEWCKGDSPIFGLTLRRRPKIGTVPAFRRLPPHPAGLVRVPAVIADQVRALRGNVLRELRQKLHRREDLKIPLRPRGQACAARIGKRPAGGLLRAINHVFAGASVPSRPTRTSRERLKGQRVMYCTSRSTPARLSAARARIVGAEAAVRPAAHVLDDGRRRSSPRPSRGQRPLPARPPAAAPCRDPAVRGTRPRG